MNVWLRRSIGVASVGGGFLGVFVAIAQTLAFPLEAAAVSAVFACVYAFGILAGTLILEDDIRGRRAGIWFWAAQVPLVQTPVLSYSLGSALYCPLTVGLVDLSLGFNCVAGSRFQLSILAPPDTTLFGLNLAATSALACVFWGLRHVES